MKTLCLCDIECGKRARILSLLKNDEYSRRLSDLGFICGTQVESVMKSPLGDPTAYLVRGALIALRREHAENILVEVI